MMQLLESLAHFRPILTALAAVVLFLSLALVERWARRLSVSVAQRRRATQAGRAAVMLLFLGVLIAIWAAKLKTVGLVLSGFAVALIVASKELIMCFTGWWIKMSASSFRIGERIVVKGIRGDVLDFGVFTTTLLEVPTDADNANGTLVVLPNSVFLNELVRNESREAALQTALLLAATPAGIPAMRALAALEAAVFEIWSTLGDQQQRALAERKEIGSPVAPRVRVRRVEKDTTHFEVDLPLPGKQARALEDAILRLYLTRLVAPVAGSAGADNVRDGTAAAGDGASLQGDG